MTVQIDLLVKNIGQLVLGASDTASSSVLKTADDAVLAVNNGVVKFAGPTESYSREYDPDRVVDASGHLVTPGFVDPHTHIVYGGERAEEFEQKIRGKSYQKIAEEGGGIQSTVQSTRTSSKEELYDTARRRLDHMLLNGTTTCEIKSGYGLTTKQEIKILTVIRELQEQHPVEIIPTFLGAHTFPEEYRNQKEKYVEIVCSEMIPEVSHQNLAEFCDVFCEQGAFSPEQTREIFKTARNYNLSLKVHAEQFEHTGGTEIAAEMNACSADHLEAIDENDVSKLKDSSTIPVLLPGTACFLQLPKTPPVDRMRGDRLPIALGTDHNPGTCTALSMPLIASLGCIEFNLLPDEAVLACTTNASKAINQEKRKGSLKPGYDADFIVWNLNHYREIPYWFGQDHEYIHRVYIEGTCQTRSRN